MRQGLSLTLQRVRSLLDRLNSVAEDGRQSRLRLQRRSTSAESAKENLLPRRSSRGRGTATMQARVYEIASTA